MGFNDNLLSLYGVLFGLQRKLEVNSKWQTQIGTGHQPHFDLQDCKNGGWFYPWLRLPEAMNCWRTFEAIRFRNLDPILKVFMTKMDCFLREIESFTFPFRLPHQYVYSKEPYSDGDWVFLSFKTQVYSLGLIFSFHSF